VPQARSGGRTAAAAAAPLLAAGAAGCRRGRRRPALLERGQQRGGSHRASVAAAVVATHGGGDEKVWRRPEPPQACGGRQAFWSTVSFSWVRTLLRRSHSSDALEVEDLLPAPGGMHAAALAEELSSGFAATAPPPPLPHVLLRLHRGQLLRTGVLRIVNSVIQFLPALCLSSLLFAIEEGRIGVGLRFAGVLFAVLCTKTFVENQYFFHISNLATRVRAMLQASIYRKSLRLPEAAASVPPVTLMQVDTGKVEELTYSVHTLWDGIFQVCGYSLLLVRYLGMAGLAGLGLLGICLPLNAWLQTKLSSRNRKALQEGEVRVARTGEVLSGIRAVRQMGWEDVFERRVNELREAELIAQRRRDSLGAYLVSYFSALPPFMIAVVLFAYVAGPGGLYGAAFRPSTIFTALSVLNQIRFPLLFYPSALNALAEGQAALTRIAAFLHLDEAPIVSRPKTGQVTAATASRIPYSAPPLHLTAGRYALSGRGARHLVVPHDVIIRPGELVAVVGAVGAGKTSLVRALLTEMPGEDLHVPHGSVAYCSQQPWVPSGTLRDVVIAGSDFDEMQFQKACSAALVDFARSDDEISAGTLSGGQQARVALARAVYHMIVRNRDGTEAIACVLDDVTAALDPQVASLVIERCLFGAFRKSARVVVTSDTGPLLQRCDRVVVMEAEAGGDLHVRAMGSHSALVGLGYLQRQTEEGMGKSLRSKETQAKAEQQGKEEAEAKVAPVAVAAARIIAEEERARGAVPLSLYRRYFAFAKSPLLLLLSLAATVATNVAMSSQQWFIGLWTADLTVSRGLSFYLVGVMTLGLVASALTFIRTVLSAAFSRRCSRAVHRELCQSVIVQASTRYFDANPSGRILQRFAKDLEQIDAGLPNNLRSAMTCVFTLMATMGTIALVTPRFLILLGPIGLLYFQALQYYRPVARELKRLEPLARSPIYAEQTSAAVGVATIRQMRISDFMADRAMAAIDASTAVSFCTKAVDRWFSLRMELLGNTIVLSAALFGLGSSTVAAPGAASAWTAARAAIAVTQALSVTGLLNWTVRTVAQAETSFGSFQRVAFTIDETEKEAARTLPSDVGLGSEWPHQGGISFRDVSLRYRDDLPLVLRGISLDIAPGERVGIVGRTGSGKSTLLRVLLRTAELADGHGCIRIDGTDIRHIGLGQLRNSLSIIPQDNFIVTGTVRANVDPRGEHGDEDVLRALEAASLGHWRLDQKIAASGVGVSPGERQLLGVARAVLRRSRIVALDEVTSRVDEATDRKVQAALRKLPSGTTLLVVSHRLSTLLEGYDTVVVMDNGRVVEVGDPQVLQSQEGSRFAELLEAELLGGSGMQTVTKSIAA